MTGIYRTFSARQLGIGLLLIAIGIVSLVQLFFSDLSHQIYIIPLVVGPIFLVAGMWTAWQSFATYFCKQCRTELLEKSAEVKSISEQAIVQALQQFDQNAIEKIELASKNIYPRLDISMRYCPACVQIGMIKVKRHEQRITVFIPWTVMQGVVVRALKDKFLF